MPIINIATSVPFVFFFSVLVFLLVLYNFLQERLFKLFKLFTRLLACVFFS